MYIFKKTALYRLYSYNQLLYVGISFNPVKRINQHAKLKDWFRDVIRVSVEWFPNRESAEKAERIAIQKENPLYNIQYNYNNPTSWFFDFMDFFQFERNAIQSDD